MMLLNHLLCPKIDFPSPRQLANDEKRPRVFKKACCVNECNACREFLRSNECILACPMLFDDATRYRWKEYGMVLLDNGNTIKELKCRAGTVEEFKAKFFQVFEKYKAHYFKYKWLNLCRHEDMMCLKPGEIFIQTDYSAQPVLDSQDKLNSVGHGVCVLSCWVILHSPRDEYYIDDKGENKCYRFYECDHVRVVSPSTGKCKDQDWFLHCKVFEYLIGEYKRKIPNLSKAIVWTDGAPNQYKCRQNFFWLTKVNEKFGIKIIHRFGATAQGCA